MTRWLLHCALIFLAILLSIPHRALAQETLLERLAEQETESNPEGETALQELLSHPLEVNRLTRQDLLRLPFLTVEQINTFLLQKDKNGHFKSLDAALAALAVTGDTLALCREIFFFSPPQRAFAPKVSTRWRMTRPATIEDNWIGAPYRSYARATLLSDALALGILAERDPGERRMDDHRLLYGHWQGGSPNREWKLLAGNYQIEWAQGLIFWGPYASTVTADVHAAVRRQGRGLLPYLAGDENAALRGAAVSWNQRRFSLLVFASSQRMDVSLHDSASAANFYKSGYHRTPTEVARRKTLQEQLAGAAINFTWPNKLKFGFIAYRSEYDKNWIRPDLAADYFNFTGHNNELIGISLSWAATELEAHMEVARSRSGGVAGSAVLSGEAPRLRWTAEAHRCARDFHSPHGRGANTVSDAPQNEFGYSLGISGRWRRNLITEIFAARRQDLWRTSSLPLPSSKWMAGARLDWKVRRDLALQLRWQQTQDEALVHAVVIPAVPESPDATGKVIFATNNPSVERQLIVPEWRRSGRMKLEYQASSPLRLTSRLDFAWEPRLRTETFRGMAGETNTVLLSDSKESSRLALALSQEFRWLVRQRLLITGRYVLFDTPSATPIYQYEHDLPGMFTNFALRERGRRWYIYVRHLLVYGIELSLKLACTERDFSIFERIQLWSWGIQLDWRLPAPLTVFTK